MAAAGLRGLVKDLRKLGHSVAGCGLLLASGRPLPPIEKILASHPLLHTAEGELFREAVRRGCGECGLAVIAVKERELFERLGTAMGLSADEAQRRVSAMGKEIGPPWRQDEKFAAAAGWIALARP